MTEFDQFMKCAPRHARGAFKEFVAKGEWNG